MRTSIPVTPIAAATAIVLLCGAGPASAGTNTVTFQQVGEHALTVPSGVTSLQVVAVGGKGGGSSHNFGGFGARVSGSLAVQPGDVRYLVVGGNGSPGDYGNGGGGASDVRTAPVSAGLSPDRRVLIAGGGGGAGRGLVSAIDPMLGNGGAGAQPGQASVSNPQGTASGGGAAGVPAGTGAGGTAGYPRLTPTNGEAGLPGVLGVGGAGAYWDAPGVVVKGYGGYNGGGLGGGHLIGDVLSLGGGGGGGGLQGGGGGGGMVLRTGWGGGGGGGGGSNLVPSGGTAGTDTSGTPSVTVSFNDATAPVVSASVPSRVKDPFTVSGTSGTALGDGALTIKIYAGAAASGTPVLTLTPARDAATGAWQESRIGTLGGGTYTLQAVQVDGAGNVGLSTARTFEIDHTEPHLSLTSPADGFLLTGAAATIAGVAGTATGDAATVEVEVRNELYALVTTLSGARDGTTGAFSFEAALPFSDGRYRFSARQPDDLGNVAATSAIWIRIDRQAPTPTLTSPAAARSDDATPTFTGTGTRAEGDANAVDVRIHAGGSTSGTVVQTLRGTVDGTGGYTVEAAPLGDGVYTAQTSQSDDAGHVGSSAARTFEIAAPTVVPPVVDPPVIAPPSIEPPVVIPPNAIPPSNGPPVVVPPLVTDTTKPALSRVGLSAKRFTVGRAKASGSGKKRSPRGTTVRYALSEPATVTFTVTRSGSKRTVGTLKRRSAKGASRFAFNGRIGKKTLRPGSYTLTLRATDAAGNRSAAKKVPFRIG